MAGVSDQLNERAKQTSEETPEPDKEPKGAMGDLLVRFVTAVAMAGITLIALWLGSWFWIAFVVLLAGLVLWEWSTIVSKFGISPLAEVAWQFVGALYVGAAALAMVQVRFNYDVMGVIVTFVLPVVAVDVGAYFAGRTIGGPKILPSVSPSKTWAGLLGGAIAAGIVCIAGEALDIGAGAIVQGGATTGLLGAALTGLIIAVLAQSGDFFESWMKRRAEVKDSSNLLPGHGGVFDRLDGFIAVFFVLFLMDVVPAYLGAG